MSSDNARSDASANTSAETRAIDADLAAIKLLVLDVDGVLTDGGVYWGPEGLSALRFNIVDGMGIVLVQRAGVEVAVLTSGDSAIVAGRVKRLGISYYRSGLAHKGEALQALLAESGIDARHVAYVSDDINDVHALRIVGMPIAVANAQPQVAAIARWQTIASGGYGAVREICNRIMAARGSDPVALWESGEPPERAGKSTGR